MSDRLFSFPGDESGEKSIVSILLTQSVFMGLFLGAFDISAHSLFLSIFDEKILAIGYIVSGIAGIILSSLFTWFQPRIQFKNFAIINLIVITSITLFLWIVLLISPAKWVIFFIFSMVGPLNIITLLLFQGTKGKLLRLKPGEKLFVLADAGLIIGIIIISFAIPLLLSINFEINNILLISASSALAATIIQIMIGLQSQQFSASGKQEPVKTTEKRSLFALFREDSYLRIIVIFLVLSIVTLFFVQYSFLAVTRIRFPSEVDLARFLGIFTGSLMLFTLLVRFILFPYLIRSYGLRTCLAISPVVIALLTAVTIATGILTGYSQESTGGLLIFFLLLLLSRFFSKSLKDSIENPSYKVIYQTIDENIHNSVQTGMTGIINEIAVLSSGLILAGLGLLSFIKLIHFSWILLIVILVWLVLAFRLYSEFRKSIRKALVTAGNASDTVFLSDQGILKNRFSADRAFRMDYFNLISGDYSVLEYNRNRWYFEKIIEHSASTQDINLLPVLKKLAANTGLDESLCQRSAEMVELLERLPYIHHDEDKKITNAKRNLSGTRLPQTTEILRLLRDNSIESKRLAIYMIGKFKLSDMLPEVCDCLNVEGLKTDAFAVIRSFGTIAENDLLRYYLVSSGNIKVSKSILRLLGKICTEKSIEFCFSRLWSNSRHLKEIALNCLISCEFKPSEEDKERLHQLISDIIGVMTWDLYAKICLEKNDDAFLLVVMKNEIRRWNEFLYNILSLTYDSVSIGKIRKNIENGTVESLNNAHEMIDIVIDDSIKPILISFLDVVPEEVKLQNIYQYFPGEIPEHNRLMEDIINRDYNLLSLWTRACTLRNLPEIKGDDMAESVVALLFSQELIIQEESAKLLARSKVDLYRSVSHRIPVTSRQRLDNIINGATNEMELLFEKVQFLSNCFTGISEEDLLPLAESMKFEKDVLTGLKTIRDDSIFWLLSDDRLVIKVYVHYAGELMDPLKKLHGLDNNSFYVLSLNAVDEHLYQFPERSFEILEYIDNNE